MKISTSTNICEYVLRDYSAPYFNCEESLKQIKKAGFDAADFCFYSYGLQGGPLTQPNYQDWVKEQAELAARLNLPLTQGHAVIYKWNDEKNKVFNEEMMRRSIISAGIMKLPWIVVHPGTIWKDGWYSREASLAANIAYFSELGELAYKHGVGIAIENMVEHRMGARTYCSGAEELIELVDSLNDSRFGICWDTGHANMNQVSQADALIAIGTRLKAVHINDNNGTRDEHTAPFFGTSNWQAILEALKQIDYDGDFTFEAQGFSNVLPPSMSPSALVFLHALAKDMLQRTYSN